MVTIESFSIAVNLTFCFNEWPGGRSDRAGAVR
jgi:hypothetical protein